MKATITIDLDNEDAKHVKAHAQDSPKAILRYLNRCSCTDSGAIMDANGNRIGSVEVSNE